MQPSGGTEPSVAAGPSSGAVAQPNDDTAAQPSSAMAAELSACQAAKAEALSSLQLATQDLTKERALSESRGAALQRCTTLTQSSH